MMKDFYLIETILWRHGTNARGQPLGFKLLDLHLERLRKSASYFGFPYREREIIQTLHELSRALKKGPEKVAQDQKVRCTLDSCGDFAITHVEAIPKIETPVKIDISKVTVNPKDPFLYHKTSRRELFDKERMRLVEQGLFDTIFLNRQGELTQGTITNLFVEDRRGMLLTPPVDCGLLPGTLRQALIRQGRAKKLILTMDHLLNANSIYVGNSVRGLLPARLITR